MVETENWELIKLAYLAASVRAGERLPREFDVVDTYLDVKRLLSCGSIMRRVAESVRITATIRGVEFEPTSRRYVITFRADGSDRDETIRSDRADGRYGQFVEWAWGSEDRTGCRAVIFKFSEQPSDPSRSAGYRNCPYVTFF